MKTKLTIGAPVVLALLAIINCPAPAWAQGTAFTYQGVLDSAGSPADGRFDLTFTLFGNLTGGVAIAGPVTNANVGVSNGLFTTSIDFGPDMLAGGSNWLEVAVRPSGSGSFSVLTPRQDLAPAPYSIVAENLAGVVGYNTLAAGQFEAVGGGSQNTAGNQYSVVGGGLGNTANGWASTVGGGSGNLASSPDGSATVGGGYQNTASGDSSVVAGGDANLANSGFATIGGGQANVSSNLYTTVGGGEGNISSGYNSTIAGGNGNQSAGSSSFVGGGYTNTASGDNSAVAGGWANVASGEQAVVAGGLANTASGSQAAVGAGQGNIASGGNTAIAGGYFNVASGNAATVAGGAGNVASGTASFAAGHTAQAVNDGSFVWSDYSGATFASTANNQFAVSAAGGVVLAGDVAMVGGAHPYHNLSLSGGNATGYLYGSFPAFGDGIHLGYNYYADNSGNDHIANTGGATSRVTMGYGFVGIYVGGVNAAPSTQRLLANSSGVTVNGTFNNSSDRNRKQDFAPISPAQMLDKVGQLPITEWSYKEDPATRHVGPVAQDFYSVFNIGTDDKHIAPIDEGGVALAAIQGLKQKLEARSQELEAENAGLKQQLAELKEVVTQLSQKLNGGNQ